jgi:hypothetical protein
MTDFRPELAKRLLNQEQTPKLFRPATIQIRYKTWLLLYDMYAPLEWDHAIELAKWGSSKYYRIKETADEQAEIVLQAGMIFDKASVPRFAEWYIPRWILPVAATVHDALYSELRYRQRIGKFEGKQDRDFRKLADWIFRDHMVIDIPGDKNARKRWLAYRAVRSFGMFEVG